MGSSQDDSALPRPAPVVLDADRAHEAPPAPTPETSEHLARAIDEFELSVRTTKCLQSADVTTIGELTENTEAELFEIAYFGRKSLAEIHDLLEGLGLSLS